MGTQPTAYFGTSFTHLQRTQYIAELIYPWVESQLLSQGSGGK